MQGRGERGAPAAEKLCVHAARLGDPAHRADVVVRPLGEVVHAVVVQPGVDGVVHHVVAPHDGVSGLVQVVESMLDACGVRVARVGDGQARAKQWQAQVP